MLDFLMVSTRSTKRGVVEIYPKFIVRRSSDLMIRGGDFYAIWNEEAKLWSTDEEVALKLIDDALDDYRKHYEGMSEDMVKVLHMWDSETGMIDKWHKYVQKHQRDNYHPLDEKLIFSDMETTKTDYASKKLPYPLTGTDCKAYDELISTLYSPDERRKIEWSIGSIISGDSKINQKFLVMYGEAGTGKSTILNIIQKLFDGYYSVFDAKALGMANNAFALESFKTNPLVAIQHDGDLSKIEDNTRLNSIVSHELMTVNEKFKSAYANRFNSFLYMGTNKPVKITDARSGILRRLIDVSPTGNKLSPQRYKRVTKQVDFELGAIAKHCLDVYLSDPGYYDNYIPVSMLSASNDFYDFVIDSFEIFDKDDGVTLKAGWDMYKVYCEDANVPYPYPRRIFQEELRSYFDEFYERYQFDDGTRVRSYFKGFKRTKFTYERPSSVPKIEALELNCTESLFDIHCRDCPAQYANEDDIPSKRWSNVLTTLNDIDTSKTHYVKVPDNHIVIDFDLKDSDGNKNKELNLQAAAKWPPTYAEFSKGGAGVHLHYIYDGDVTKLSRIYEEDVEIKVFTGKSSLRRRLSYCNDLPISTISTGLPLKGDSKVVNKDVVKTERGLRTTIIKALNKEVWPNTKPSMDFIYKILDDAYMSGMKYDVTDLRPAIMTFAAKSSHQAGYCLGLISKIHFCSDDPSENSEDYASDKLIFFDVEVFPNLFVIVWKMEGPSNPVKMINPTPEQVEELMKYKLVGFNCRRYDNHILYARYQHYDNMQLFKLSQRIIEGSRNAFFGEAYNISYTDVYDFSSKKQGLKKFEIELGIHHQELGLPWDKPVPEELWPTVADYCINDVIATEAVFNARKGDFLARQILADVAGGIPNDTTNSLTTKIIFGKERHPNLEYTDLSELFPGYEYIEHGEDNKAHNVYRGEDVGFGGYVYAEPGMYGRAITFDVASMHPSSILAMNCFGEYTKRFKDILDARLAIKHKDFDTARKMLDGKLAPYLEDESQAKMLAQALKIAINSVYGLTSAKFDNPFRDPRNVNNIVALRGALFMVNLKHEVQARGFRVIHIKTDSIKIEDPSPEIFEFVMDYGRKYGYNFEVEHIFEKICLVNDAVYIAKLAEDDPEEPGKWTATGAQFQHPYIFKTLFSRESLEFKDFCETKTVTSSLYLDFNEKLGEDEHDYHFVGRAGLFCPVKPNCGGGILLRESDGKYNSATGAKGYRWMESEILQNIENWKDIIDMTYFNNLVDDAVASISEYGDFEWFIDPAFEE